MKSSAQRNFMIGTGIAEAGGIASVLKTLKSSNLFEQWNIELVQTHTNKSIFFGLNKAILFAFALLKLTFNFTFKNIGFTHIHIASRGSFTRKSVVILLCKLFRVPVILHLHGAEFREFYQHESSERKQRWIRASFDYADQIIVLSSQWHSWVTSIVSDKSKVSIIYNALPSAPVNLCERIPFTVLFLGRLGQRKGVYDLLKVSCMLAKEFPSFKLILGGDGDIDACRNFVRENSLEKNVDIIGWIDGEAKDRLLATSAVFTLPSYNEGFPVGVLEAMSAGTPIISTTAGGIPDAITSDIEGVLIEPGDVNALYLALKDAFTNERKFCSYAKQAKIKFESQFTLTVIASQISSLYSVTTNEIKR